MDKWQRARKLLREKLGDQSYETWIKPLRAVQTLDGFYVVSAPSKFYRDWVKAKYLPLLQSALAEGKQLPEIVFEIDEPQGELFAPQPSAPRSFESRRARVGNLNPEYTFPNFVVGPSNQFAHATAQLVATKPGEQYNPLFIYGAVGVGKTHLVNAVGHSILERNPAARIVYLSSESFVTDLISSLRRDRMDDFKNRFRKVDLLILDDVQFLAGRERTQEEFFHTFNSLHEARRQIVLTCDKFPKEISDLEERLRNRFEWGLTADIQVPEIETRVAIALKKAEMQGVPLPGDVAELIAAEIGSNVREIEGALTRLFAAASVHRATITTEYAREVLKPHLRGHVSRCTIEDVQGAVCEEFRVSLSELKSKRRTQHVTLARQIGMYISRKCVQASYPVIGEKFGGRDHTTAMYAFTTIGERSKRDPSLRDVLLRLERRTKRH